MPSPNQRNKEVINEPIFIDKKKVLDNIYKSLFKNGKINIEYLSDDEIFKDLEEGLSHKEIIWLRERRDHIIEEDEIKRRKKENKQMSANTSQTHSLRISSQNMEETLNFQNSYKNFTVSRFGMYNILNFYRFFYIKKNNFSS